jgi:hypothetical protein
LKETTPERRARVAVRLDNMIVFFFILLATGEGWEGSVIQFSFKKKSRSFPLQHFTPQR